MHLVLDSACTLKDECWHVVRNFHWRSTAIVRESRFVFTVSPVGYRPLVLACYVSGGG